jgi:ABC-type bacteriocin/lantibiotic exporter with double-glycine peptidase domain
LVQLSLPLGIQAIIGFSFGAQLVVSIYVLIILVILGVFIVGVLNLNLIKLIEILQQKIFAKSAIEITETLLKIDLQDNNKFYLPEKVNRYFEIFSIQKGLSKLLLDIPLASIQIIIGLIVLAFYESSFIVFGLFLIVLLWLILKYTSNLGLLTSLKESNDKYELASWLEDIARAVRTFKFSQNSDLAVRKSDELASIYLQDRNKHFSVLIVQYKALIAFKVLITAAMLGIGTYLLIEQKINIGEFIAAEIVILMVIGATEKLIYHLDSLYDVAAGLSKLESIMEQPLERNSHYDWQPPSQGGGPAYQLSNFNFKFEDSKKEVLKNLTLSIPANGINVIVGNEGDGKTTLLHVLASLYRDYDGSLRVDEIELSSYSATSFRRHCGFYFRNQEIISGTILENITLGKIGVSTEEVMALIKELKFQSIIQGNSNGLEATLEPFGSRLSTNMVKKIILLRALVHQPKVLFMDEPFIGLFDSEKKLLISYLQKIKNHTTIFIIANDAEVWQISDRMISLTDGEATIKELR